MKKFSIVIISLLLIAGISTAQEFAKVGTAGAQFLKIGVGSRGIAMGEAYDAVGNDATSIFWNPAGLAFVKNQSVMFSHANWIADISYDAAAYAYSLGAIGVVGLSFAYLNSGDIEETLQVFAALLDFMPSEIFKKQLELHMNLVINKVASGYFNLKAVKGKRLNKKAF